MLPKKLLPLFDQSRCHRSSSKYKGVQGFSDNSFKDGARRGRGGGLGSYSSMAHTNVCIQQYLRGDEAAVELAEDVQLAHSPGDEVAVLRPKVENGHLERERWGATMIATLPCKKNRITGWGTVQDRANRMMRAYVLRSDGHGGALWSLPAFPRHIYCCCVVV